MNFRPTKPQLKVASAVFSNFFVFWFLAVLTTTNIMALTADVILAIFCWYSAVSIEERLGNL